MLISSTSKKLSWFFRKYQEENDVKNWLPWDSNWGSFGNKVCVFFQRTTREQFIAWIPTPDLNSSGGKVEIVEWTFDQIFCQNFQFTLKKREKGGKNADDKITPTQENAENLDETFVLKSDDFSSRCLFFGNQTRDLLLSEECVAETGSGSLMNFWLWMLSLH